MVLDARITGITSFGAFAEYSDGQSGLIHISEIATEYVEDVNQYLKKGQRVRVKVIAVDGSKVSLSLKKVDAAERLPEPKSGKAAKDKSKKKSSPPTSTKPPEEFEFVNKRDRGDMSFDDMLQKFKQDSDEKFQALKRSNDSKRSGGYKRAY